MTQAGGDIWPSVDDDEPPARREEVNRPVAGRPDPPEPDPDKTGPAAVPAPHADETVTVRRPIDPAPVPDTTPVTPPSDPTPPAEQTRVIPVVPPTPSPAPQTPPPSPAPSRRLAPQDAQRMRIPEPPRPSSPGPQRAAPVRVGPVVPEPRDKEPTLRAKPRRRMVLILVIALLVLAGGGAGALYGVPGLAEKVGLRKPGEPTPSGPPPAPVSFSSSFQPPDTTTHAPSAAGVTATLAGPLASPALGTLTGEVLDPVTGGVLWQQGAGTPIAPASTGKLLVSAAALLSVDHAQQFTTTVVAGQQQGTVVIVGGGDPTLSSLKPGTESVYPGAAHLTDLVNQVKASAGGPVDTVLLDLGRYTGDSMAKGWDPRDVAGGFITPIVPAMMDGGRSDATKSEPSRTANPARALAEEFARRIGAKVPSDAVVTAPQGAKVLGQVRSAPLVELVDNLLQISDNVLAEAVGREVARAGGAETSFAGAIQTVLKVLQDNGFDTTGVAMSDSSGLSTLDKVPAELLASILSVAAGPDGKDPRTVKLRPLLGGLPVAGGSGTLADRYATPASAPGKGWVRAKTGTLSDVNTLAGVVLDSDGRLLVFTLMTGGSVSTTARPALDAVTAALRKCGCA